MVMRFLNLPQQVDSNGEIQKTLFQIKIAATVPLEYPKKSWSWIS